MCGFQHRLLRHKTFVIVKIRSSARNVGRGCLDGNTLIYAPFRASAAPLTSLTFFVLKMCLIARLYSMGCGAAFTLNFLYSEYVLRLQGAACAPDGGTARIGAFRRAEICNTVSAPDVEAVRIDDSAAEAKLWYCGTACTPNAAERRSAAAERRRRSARSRRLRPDRSCVFLRLFCDAVCRAALFGFAGIFSSCLFLLFLLTTDGQACILCISDIYRKGAPPVDVIVSNASAQPIYEQIYSQLKAQILSGALREGELLPSIRALAKDLRISVITTKRAYDELEKDGYIYTVAGKGCYVAERNEQLVREEYLKQIEAHMQAIVENAAACGIRGEALRELLLTLLETTEGADLP